VYHVDRNNRLLSPRQLPARDGASVLLIRQAFKDSSAMDVTGKRLSEVDPWAYEHFMKELRLCANFPEYMGKPELVKRLLADLPSAIVSRKCDCGDHGCHAYSFYFDSPDPGHIYSLAFQTPPRWDSFLVDYLPDGTLVGVEILVDERTSEERTASLSNDSLADAGDDLQASVDVDDYMLDDYA
jgi:hypothetical protein